MSTGELAYLVELDLVDPDDAPVTLHLSDLPMRPFPSTDPDRPSVAWDAGRVLEAPTVSMDLHGDASRLTGALGASALGLANADGFFNAYRGWVWKRVRVYWGVIRPAGQARSFAADFRQVADLRCETPSWAVSTQQPGRITVPIYDRRLDFEDDVQPVTFAGDNAGGAADYEGTGDGLGGRPKPLALGDLTTGYIPLTWVNGPYQVGQVHAGEIQGYTEVYDRGQAAGLVDDGDVADATFDAATPATGHYTTNEARALIRMDQAFGGAVTVGCLGAVDLVAGAGYLDTAVPLIEALIKRQDPAASIGASFAALAATATETVGLYIADRTPVRQVVDELARALPGWVLPDPLGTWQVGKLKLPTGTPHRTIQPTDILGIADGDAQAGVPAWRVTVRGARYYQVHDRSNGSLAGALWDTDDEQRLKQEWRQSIKEDLALKAKWWPNVREIGPIDTPRRDPADLQAVADLIFSVNSVRADGTPFEERVVTVEMDEEWLDLLADPGLGVLEVRLVYPDDDFDRTLLAIGAKPGRPRGDRLTLRLWG